MKKLLAAMTTMMTTMRTKVRVRLGRKRYWRTGRVVFTTDGFVSGCGCTELTKKQYRKLLDKGLRKGRFKRPFPIALPGWWLE